MKKKAVKLLSILLAAALLIGASVGGTLAWLSAKSDTVVNTFTVGNINIKLEETGATDADNNKIFDKSFKMVPGSDIAKDPTITVEKGSEACWLFVQVEESSVLDDYITYAMAEGWNELTPDSGIYYREVAAVAPDAAEASEFGVLAGNKVTVKNTVTKTTMEALNKLNATQPTLTFTAYAVQKDNVNTATEAWTIAQNNGVPTNP